MSAEARRLAEHILREVVPPGTDSRQDDPGQMRSWVLTAGCSPKTGITHWIVAFGQTACGYWSKGWGQWEQSSRDALDCQRCDRKRLREARS